jgi:lantibiotic biosynthesis protein
MQTTYAAVTNGTPAPGFSLCHGLAGNAELFLVGGQLLLEPALHVVAEEIANAGRDQYHVPRRPWPCGITGGGTTPGLMLGLAGIGYFYLRAADPARTPSILV